MRNRIQYNVVNQNETSYVDNVPIIIIRSKRRRSFGIQVKESDFILRVPFRASRSSIEHSLNRFTPWIRRKKAILDTAGKAPTYTFKYGEEYPWLESRLILTDTHQPGMPKLVENKLLVNVPKSVRNRTGYLHKRVVQYYKNAGLKHLMDRVNYFADIVGQKPDGVRIYSYKRRWGSCSSQRILTFNWSILLAPSNVVDYVVIHELAHLVHFDHSKSYWQVVERVMPNYKSQQNWLKINGHLLSLTPADPD